MTTQRSKRKADGQHDAGPPTKKLNHEQPGNASNAISSLQSNSESSNVKRAQTDGSSSTQNKSHKIIVAVDYGTTYTGVSYVSTDKSDINDIAIISSWPGPNRDGENVSKVPSRIAYPFNNPDLQENKWGFHVEAGMTAYSWTKLLLDRNTPETEFDDTTLNSSAGMGIFKLPEDKNASAVVADFLASVYKYTMFILEKQISAGALAVTPIEFWFTIPAMWRDQPQRAMKDAAILAGFASRPGDGIFMISEPEAAAITTLKKSTTNAMRVPVEPGDGILVCDCGGGTVDISSYWIKEIYPRLVFDELCTGIGGKCGSSSTDRNLYQLMSKRFGRSFDVLPLKMKGPGSKFMSAFERIKRHFGRCGGNMVYELPLNISAKNVDREFFDYEEREVRLTTRDVRQLFDPVIDKIIKLAKQQLITAHNEDGRPAVKHIFLVGGFGDSEYLRQAFNREFTVPNLQITVPDYPQAATVKGAALRGLEGTRPTTRRCRRHYGFMLSIAFREGIDAEEHSHIGVYDGRKLVSGIMNWTIEKGEKISENMIQKIDVRTSDYGDRPGTCYLKFFSSSLDDAPERHDHPRVDLVGTIKCDFSGISPNKVESKFNHEGRRVYAAHYVLQVLLGTKEGILGFQTAVNGEIVGKADIDFGES